MVTQQLCAGQYLHCADCESTDSEVEQNKEGTRRRLEGKSLLVANGHVTGRGYDVTSAITVLLSSQ